MAEISELRDNAAPLGAFGAPMAGEGDRRPMRARPPRWAREAALILAIGVVCVPLTILVGKAGTKGIVALVAAAGLVAAVVLIKRRSMALMVGLVISLIVLQHKRLGPLNLTVESGSLGLELSSADVVVAVMYVVWALEGTLRRDLRRALRQPVVFAPLIGMILMSFSLFEAQNVYLGVSELFRTAWVYLLFLYFAARVRSRSEIVAILGALGFFACVEFVVVLLQWKTGGVLGLSFLGVPTALSQRTIDIGDLGRPFGTIIHPVFLADVLGMLAIVALCLAVYLENPRLKRLCAAAIPVCVIPIALASARGPGLALVLTTILIGSVLLARHRLSRRTILITLALCAAAVAVAWPEVDKLIVDNFGTHHLGVEIQARLQLNGVASRMIDSSPFLGVGLDNYTQVMHTFAPYPLLFPGFPAHNLYLLQTAETGLIGLGALLMIGTSLLWVSVRVSRSRDPLFAALGTAMAAIVVFNAIEEMLSYSLREEVPLAIFWLLSGLVVAARRIAFDERNAPPGMALAQESGGGGGARHRRRRRAPGLGRRRTRSYERPTVRIAPASRPRGAPRHLATRRPRSPRIAVALLVAMAIGLIAAYAVAPRAMADRTPHVGSVRHVVGASQPDIVFSAVDRSTGDQSIYVLDVGASVPTQISPDDGGYYSWPEWVLGGQKIIYTVNHRAGSSLQSAQNIVMSNADGSDPVQLTDASWRIDQPKVNPSGTEVLFDAFWPGYPTVALYVLNLRTLAVTNLSARNGVGPTFDSDPEWTATGKIVYTHATLTKNGKSVSPSQIWMMNGDGSDAHRLTHDRYFDVDGTLSPEGQTIAYSSYEGPGSPTTGSGADEDPFDLKLSNWFIEVQPLHGGAAHALNQGQNCSLQTVDDACSPTQGAAANPQWSADGSTLGFIAIRAADDECICSIAANGTNPQVIYESTELAIDWFSWVVPNPSPLPATVLDPGTGGSSSTFLWGSAGVGTAPLLAVSAADLWGDSTLSLPSGLTPLDARWSPDGTEIAFTAKVPFNPNHPRPSPPLPRGVVPEVHYTLSDFDAGFVPATVPSSTLPDEQVFLLNTTTDTVRQVTTPWTEDWRDALRPGEARANTDPSFSPDGRYLLVTNISDLDGESFVLRIDLATGAVVNLTNVTSGAMPVADSDASYSPDSSMIAFSSVVGTREQIYLMDANGTHVRRLTHDTDEDESPTWSPDGKSLAYTSYDGPIPLESDPLPLSPGSKGEWALMRLDVGTGSSSIVTRASGGVESPEYSPNGKQIAFLSLTPSYAFKDYFKPDIYVVGASGGVAAPRQPMPYLFESFFDWR